MIFHETSALNGINISKSIAELAEFATQEDIMETNSTGKGVNELIYSETVTAGEDVVNQSSCWCNLL